MSELTDKVIAAGWHEYRYPRPATDKPSAAFLRGLAAVFYELHDQGVQFVYPWQSTSTGTPQPGVLAEKIDKWVQKEEQPTRKTPCPEGFHWVGQSFRYCDKCGLPAWDHAGEARLPQQKVSTDIIFGGADLKWVLKPWEPGEREACFRKWTEPGDTLPEEVIDA